MWNFYSKSDEVLDLEDVSESVKFMFFTPFFLFIKDIDY